MRRSLRPADMRLVDLLAARITITQVITASSIATGALLVMTGMSVVPFAPFFGRLPGWPWLYGAILATGGIVLASASPRKAHLCAAVGAAMSAFGWLSLMSGFVVLWFDWLAARGQPGAAPYFPPYPAAAYGGYVAVHLVYADTELRAWLANRRARRG